MASVRKFKKNVNNVFGDIIGAALFWEQNNEEPQTEKTTQLITDVIEAFNSIIKQINQRDTEDRVAHLKIVKRNFQEQVAHFIERLNQLK